MYLDTNNIKRKVRISFPYKILQTHVDFIISKIDHYKSITLRELKIDLEIQFTLFLSKQHIRRILLSKNISRKRVRHGHFPLFRRGVVTDKKIELSTFYKEIKKYPINKIISIDETSLNPYMYRKYGYSEKGIRCIESLVIINFILSIHL
jgi:hypothetical protein